MMIIIIISDVYNICGVGSLVYIVTGYVLNGPGIKSR
jgi:hypothetical protein